MTTSTRSERARHRPRPAFTIVEVLVVVGVMVLLIGLLTPALKAVRRSASQTVESSAARQLMVAYIAYTNVNRDRVMPGYYQAMTARDDAGQKITSPIIRARYPWRIAPYIDYQLATLFPNEQQEYFEEARQQGDFLYHYLVSVFPSLGLNTRWLGGDEDDRNFDDQSAYHRIAASTLTEVRRPAELIVFASARGGDPAITGIDRTEGFFRVRSPYFREEDGYEWSDTWRPNDTPEEFGFLSLRFEDAAVTAMVDGHVESLTESQLLDMRRWANRADTDDWRLPAASTGG